MQFRRALCNMLRKQGYESIPETDGLCWRMRGDGEIWIVQLVPEHLPGQALIPLQERDRWGTDRQMLILLSDRPSEEQIRELERFPHAWYLDKNDGAVYLYENQRGDFHHLREATEIFSQEYVRGKKEHDRLEMKKMFTPVNTVLIVLNVLIFLGLSLLGDPGDPDNQLRRTEELSLENRVTKDTPPTFLWHTAEDPSVPVENSLQYAAALRRNGVPFELHVFEQGGHGVSTCQEITATDESQILPDAAAWLPLAVRFVLRHWRGKPAES